MSTKYVLQQQEVCSSSICELLFFCCTFYLTLFCTVGDCCIGSRRPSISSIHSTASSQKSLTYSARRFEQENTQREHRAAMRAARDEASRTAAPPTPSPMSTDELLPSCSKLEVGKSNWAFCGEFDIICTIFFQNDPLGFTSSVLSIKSGASPRENSIPEFPTKLSPCEPSMLRH